MPAVPYAVRLAREEDVPQLVDIEKEAFPTSWPATPFKRELSNRSASFLAAYRLSEDGQPSIPAPGKPLHEGSAVTSRGLGGVLKRLFRREAPSSFLTRPSDYVAGYVATWYMTDEAHITGIAVRESLRGNGLGELLLLTSIQLAMRRQSRVVTLEVRVSNQVAQSLYSKCGFDQVGLRKGYDTDNHEDAYIMTTAPISSPAYSEQFHTLEKSYRERRGNMALGLG